MKASLSFCLTLLMSLCLSLVTHGQQSGDDLCRQAWKAYEKGYDSRLPPAEQARHFDEAARLYEEAAKAYEKAGQADKAGSARGMAHGARQNAEHRRKRANASSQQSSRSTGADQVQIRATGRTTGHVADAVLTNPGSKTRDVTLPRSAVIASNGQHQGYAIPIMAGKVTVPAGQTRTVRLTGYCTHPDLPAASPGTVLPGLTDWPPAVLPSPQTVQHIEAAAQRLQQRGAIRTPFDDPNIVAQHTFWSAITPAYDPCAYLRALLEEGGVSQDLIPSAIAQVVNAVLQTGHEAGLPGYQPTLPILPVQPPAPSSPTDVQPTVSVSSTGQTTGHIGNLTVVNPSVRPITAVFGGGGGAYIPSLGDSQPYLVPQLPVVPVPPKGTVTVPIHGYCADVRRPPVPLGKDLPPVSSWITTTPAGELPALPNLVRLPAALAPPLSEATRVLQNQPLPPVATKWDCLLLPPVASQPLLPGTDTPIRAPVSASNNPGLAVPILLDALRRLEDAYTRLKGTFTTPFSNNPPKEREAVIQQTLWIYAAALEGNPYTLPDFRGNTIQQFESNTGRPYNSLPPEQKDKLDKGVDDFWEAFSATGAAAKILPEESNKPAPVVSQPAPKPRPRATAPATQPTAPTTPSTPVTGPGKDLLPPPEKDDLCHLKDTAHSHPDYDIKFKISENAVSQDKIKEATEAMEKRIQALLEKDEGGEYGAPEPIATTYSVWAVNHIGGYANAVSKALVSNRYGRWNGFINNTEKISTSAQGERILVMAGRNDKKCKTTVVGVGLVSLTAHTVAFDPTASNIEFLRGVNFVGKVAMEIAKAYLTGGASLLSKANRARKAIKEAIQTVAKEEATEQIGKILESEGVMSEEDFSNLIEWMESIKDDEVKEKVAKDLAEAMGIDTKWLTFDLEPADFAPVASDTYCKMQGKMDLTVGAQSGSISAASSVLYKRSNLDENPKDVMKGGGTHCPTPLILSDVQPGSLTIRLKGLAETEAQAQGNGTAQGFLSNGVVLIQYAICVCPEGWEYDLRIDQGYFNGKPGASDINMMRIRLAILEEQMDAYAKKYDGQQNPPDPKTIQKDLENLARAWAKEYGCKE
jgi:hypothetical protein